MFHTSLVVAHVVGAVGALISGFLALRYPNGTPTHRLIGKSYLAMWIVLFASGAAIGWRRPGVTPFEVLNVLGMLTVTIAYGAVLLRKRIGRSWLRHHYNWMVSSIAFLVVATINQVLPRLGVTYPMWVFYLMVASPGLIIPLYVRWLDQRYGFGQQRTVRPINKEAIF